MVFVILIQVIFRYLLNSAMPWPDEAARFLMLWMTGLIAPLAYRNGGFVAIDMLALTLSRYLALALTLAILLFSAVVLYMAFGLGWAHTMGFSGNFESSSLKIPLEWLSMESIKLKLRYMYASLLTCIILMSSVNIELILYTVMEFFKPDPDATTTNPDQLNSLSAD